jgi:hypothetical protein
MAILLSFSSSPLWAQEDVYFCNMMENIDIKNHDMQKIELYHFKFMVTPEKIIFGSDGYFEDSFINIYQHFNPDEFYGGDKDSVFKFISPNFYYADIFTENVKVITATCDRF